MKKCLHRYFPCVKIPECAARRGYKCVLFDAAESGEYCEEGVIRVEKLGVEKGEKVTFDNVLAIGGEAFKAGEDVKDATVEADVISNGRTRKVIVYKYKAKTGYHKKNGHRQHYTAVKITKINA